ncbi:hypothetical protein ACQUJS_09130 [Ralstonia pseudosolanacearum]|uniref:Uncharacterized protein n=1 Tax=Ralstonia solanacearum TaxID=305 RepID=A0A0S4TYP9_RALSL|nr:protein of unknown function [Ralstonia solanacearum]
MQHILEVNATEQEYFGRLNKNGKAAYRRAVTTLTGGLPTWAVGPRTKVTTFADAKKVTTSNSEVVTVPDVDPLTLVDTEDLKMQISRLAATSKPAKATTLPDVDPLPLT